jgi:uncharacterized membrane protein YuzA (DUF378 family)
MAINFVLRGLLSFALIAAQFGARQRERARGLG